MEIENKFDEYIDYWSNLPKKNQQKYTLRKKLMRNYARNCAQILHNKYNAKKVYLIGSLLKNRRIDSHSDIDLVVEGLIESLYFSILNYLYEQIPKELIGIQIDLITIESASNSLIAHTKKFGEILHE